MQSSESLSGTARSINYACPPSIKGHQLLDGGAAARSTIRLMPLHGQRRECDLRRSAFRRSLTQQIHSDADPGEMAW